MADHVTRPGCGSVGTMSIHEVLDSGRHAKRMTWMMAMRLQCQVYKVCIPQGKVVLNDIFKKFIVEMPTLYPLLII